MPVAVPAFLNKPRVLPALRVGSTVAVTVIVGALIIAVHEAVRLPVALYPLTAEPTAVAAILVDKIVGNVNVNGLMLHVGAGG